MEFHKGLVVHNTDMCLSLPMLHAMPLIMGTKRCCLRTKVKKDPSLKINSAEHCKTNCLV